MSKEGILERNEPGVGWAKRMFKLSGTTLTTYNITENVSVSLMKPSSSNVDSELLSFPIASDITFCAFCVSYHLHISGIKYVFHLLGGFGGTRVIPTGEGIVPTSVFEA